MIDIDELYKYFSMSIEHNDHKNYYITVEDFFKNHELFRDCISDEEFKKCVESDDMWCIRIYPHTPISFIIAYANTFEKCLELIKDEIKKEKL